MSAQLVSTTAARPVKVLKCVRTGTTTNGNPLYVLHTDAGLFKSREDTAQVYRVENDFPTEEQLDVDAVIRFDEDGRFWDWDVVSQ